MCRQRIYDFLVTKRILILAALAGCGTDDGPHDVIEKVPGVLVCERACCGEVPNDLGPCSASSSLGDTECPFSFEYEGIQGCCFNTNEGGLGPEPIVFAECE